MRISSSCPWPLLLLLANLVVAQMARSPSPTSPSQATHTIGVGPREDPHQYFPHSVNASVGDLVVFEFYPRNHSVVQADFGAPCVPAKGDFFYSGVFNSFNEEDGQLVGDPPTWTLRINDTKPIFFYCTGLDSCTENGMVGAINPNASMSWEAQHERALEYPYMLVPGQSPPAEGEQPGSPDLPSSSPSLSKGAIAGIVVGCVAVVAILIALFFVLGRNRVYRKWLTSQDGRTNRTRRWALDNSTGGPEWSTAAKSDIGAGTINGGMPPEAAGMSPSSYSPRPGHTSFVAPMSQHQGVLFNQCSPPLASGGNAHWSWDGADGGWVGSPKQGDDPQELSSGDGGVRRVEVAELDAGVNSHPTTNER